MHVCEKWVNHLTWIRISTESDQDQVTKKHLFKNKIKRISLQTTKTWYFIKELQKTSLQTSEKLLISHKTTGGESNIDF